MKQSSEFVLYYFESISKPLIQTLNIIDARLQSDNKTNLETRNYIKSRDEKANISVYGRKKCLKTRKP